MTPLPDTSACVGLVVADVDGTLVTPDNVVTPLALAAVRALGEAGIAFTITSGRPPRGMKMVIDELGVQQPIAAFNGGLFVAPDLSVVRERLIERDIVPRVIDILTRGGLDVWLYAGTEWRVRSRHGPHVEREERTVTFSPTVVPTFDGVEERIAKIVGVSDDAEAMVRCAGEIRRVLGQHVSAALSQPYYLDVTHPAANKGEVVSVLSELLDVDPKGIATIGDMPTDLLMFARSGMSIAMANASAEVQRGATFVTSSNREDGFALAMERWVLPRARRMRPQMPDRIAPRSVTRLS